LKKLLNRYYWAIKHLLSFLVEYSYRIVHIMMELINLYYCFAALAFTALVTQKLGSCPELRVEESPGN